ncbi:PKD domain-containing protein [Streptomyces sp. NPDC001980]|uniref:PKD domain-containing protein n=1 Tax=Streptomyces sp. NPDC001980 TaxID=3157126 RepID=UPI0033332C68
MHRSRPAVGLSLAMIVVVGAMSGWGTGRAMADPGPGRTLYVEGYSTVCSDSGTGTESRPFCTVQAAADVVEPGDTVRILGDYSLSPHPEAVTLTRSGTSDKPITFSGAPLPSSRLRTVLATPASAPALTLKGVHDVRVESLAFTDEHHSDVVAVTGSDHVTLDRLTVDNAAPTVPVTGTAIGVDGTSSDVTVSRNTINPSTAYGVRVAPGAARVTVTTNVILTQQQAGIAVSGTADADVTSNTVFAPCATAISLDGGSSGVVENNVAFNVTNGSMQTSSCQAPTAPFYAVSADSASRVTADYNVAAHEVSSSAPARTEYSWAGTSYATSAAFRDGTGQGTHDIDGINAYPATPAEHSPLIDSADATAPGELSTDSQGRARVDDLLVDNTGTGTTAHPDRGALERQDTLAIASGDVPTPPKGLAPLGISMKTDATSSWGAALAYSVDFGDGSDPATGTPGTPVSHTYTTPGLYTTRITFTEPDGTSAEKSYAGVAAGTATPPAAALSVAPDTATGQVAAGLAQFTVPAPADPWEVEYRTLSFGDGTQDNLPTDAQEPTQPTHQYAAPGTYTATLTQTDLLGRTTTAKTVFHAADAFVAVTPQYDTEKTIAAHGVLTLSAATLRADSNGADAVQLQLVTSNAKASGALTLYTHGTTRPGTAAIAFEPGRTATAETTVKVTPTGSVDLYNGSSGAVTVDVATVGLQSHAQYADTYHPVTPARLLDTRTGTGGTRAPVAGGHSVTLAVGGTHGVPADAHAVVLDVTATTTKASGDLTVATHSTNDSVVSGPYWTTGQTATTQVVIPVYDGKVVLHNDSKASANLVVDLAGWYGTATGGSEFLPVTPARILNTRTGTGTGKVARLAAHGTLKLKVTGAHGVPATGVTAADLNLTVPAPSGNGYLVAYPDGTSRPGVYSLNFTKGHTAAGRALVKVGTDGEIDLYNAGTTSVDVYADLLGDYDVFPATS